jgi:hypothetical protein
MTQTFVKYGPDVEQADPGFHDAQQRILAKVDQLVADSFTTGEGGEHTAIRSAHAKGYGLARAEVEILDGLPPEYAQGIYALPGVHEALIRYSNGSGHVAPDAVLGNGTGMGLKIFEIEGPTLLEDEPDSRTFDYANISFPTFFASSAEHYAWIQSLFADAGSYASRGRKGMHEFFHQFVTGMGTLEPEEWAWDELGVLLQLAKLPPVNILLKTHWTMGSVRHGAYMAKVSFAPTKESTEMVTRRVLDPPSTPEIYRPTLVAELKEHPYEYDLRVQLCVDLEKTPVEDLTVEWSEQLSPPVTVAKIRVPQQDISGEENLQLQDATSISAWRVTEKHRPLGSLMRCRKEVYRHSSILRHKLNHQVRREPRNLAEAFGAVHVSD